VALGALEHQVLEEVRDARRADRIVAEPLRYHTMWVATGTRRSGMTTTSRPLSRV
jgi:hypothetical protein